MKKTVLFILIVATLFAAAIYLIIPSTLTINSQVTINASDNVASKFLINSPQWIKWWPGTMVDDNRFNYKNVHLSIIKTTNGGDDITLQKDDLTFRGNIRYLAGDFVVKVTLLAQTPNCFNPIKRIGNYMAVRDLQKKTYEILQRLKTFLEDGKNAYGYKIYIAKITTPILLASTKTSVNYPGMQTVYSTIKELKHQADANHVKVTDQPMLNVTKIDNGLYQVSVAIAIEKTITPNQNSSINHMVAGGNLLVADVNGGPNTIINAFTQVKAFMKDHNLISPAMPYESLITNRVVEKDTAKWVTKIYYPIF